MNTPRKHIAADGRGELAAFWEELKRLDRQALDGDFGGCVFVALEAVKGTLLFQMQIDEERESRKVAGVSVGHGDGREYALVILPEGADHVRIERADESDDPLASIAPSYADLIDVLDIAA